MTLLDIESLAMAWPSKPLFKDLSFTVKNGERIGVLGINGSGKSTLLRIIAGLETADSGIIRRQRGLQTSCLWQRPDIGNVTVQDAVGHSWQADAALDRLGLSAITDRKVTTLSGGQAKRVALAITLLDNDAELLILDEPTNHLDMRSCEVLSAAMYDYEGTLCIISHDRYFLDGFVNRVWEVKQGSVSEYIGNYSEYENSKTQEREIELSSPTISIKNPAISSQQRTHDRKRIEAENRNIKHQTLKPLLSDLKKIEALLEKVLTEKTIVEKKLANSGIYESKNKAQLLEILNQQMKLSNEEKVLTENWDKLSSQIETFNANSILKK